MIALAASLNTAMLMVLFAIPWHSRRHHPDPLRRSCPRRATHRWWNARRQHVTGRRGRPCSAALSTGELARTTVAVASGSAVQVPGPFQTPSYPLPQASRDWDIQAVVRLEWGLARKSGESGPRPDTARRRHTLRCALKAWTNSAMSSSATTGRRVNRTGARERIISVTGAELGSSPIRLFIGGVRVQFEGRTRWAQRGHLHQQKANSLTGRARPEALAEPAAYPRSGWLERPAAR